MSLTINTPLTTNDGGSIASGAHVIFETNFPAIGFNYNINMSIFRDEQAYINNLRPIRGINEIPYLSFEKQLTEVDFSGLTPQIIHQQVQLTLEGYVGDGNVVIN